MNDMVWFSRKALGRRGAAKCGLLISRPSDQTTREQNLSFRLNETVLARLRWIEGDLVIAGIARNGSTEGVCKIRRVPSVKDGGCKLSGHGKKTRNLVVRFTVDDNELRRVFKGDSGPYSGELVRVHDDGTAEFRVTFG